jgi:hypothetical protein
MIGGRRRREIGEVHQYRRLCIRRKRLAEQSLLVHEPSCENTIVLLVYEHMTLA